MAKFNKTASIRTTNKSGHAAYSMTDKAKLVTQVLTSFFDERKFYGDNTPEMIDTINRVIKADPAFVAHLAVFARREFNMRSVAHVLTAMLAKAPEGKPYVRAVVDGVCVRGDDATEIMSCYLSRFGKPIPNALKRGLADVLKRFDAYTLAKYKGSGKAVKMRDLLCLCHPKPANDAQAALWKSVIDGTIQPPVTWETELSANGNNRETWERLIDSNKVGYMALLRNLRNIVNAGPRNIYKVWAKIENPAAIRKSGQLPFRFLSAYKELENAGSLALDTLENAVDHAADNLRKIPGTTVIAVDVSGSMHTAISANSKIRCCEIGMMLGLLANRLCENAIFVTFNNSLNVIPVSKRSGILYACTHEARATGGTNMALPFNYMIKNHVYADRVLMISDNECNSRWWGGNPVQRIADEYRKLSGRDIWVHAVDLMGYGTQQFYGPKTNVISGWSEKVLDFIMLAEQGEDALEKRIANYVIGAVRSSDV